MTRRLNALAAALCTALWLASPAAWAEPVLRVDFGVNPGDPLQPGFQAMTGATSDPTPSQAFGDYTVSLTGDGFFTAHTGSAVDAAVRGLFQDYYYNNSPAMGDGITLSIAGVTPNTAYEVKLWSYDADNFGSETPTTWSPFGDTSGTSGGMTNVALPRPTTLAEYSTTLQLTSTSGSLDLFGTTTDGFGGTRLNGFQLFGPGSVELLSVDFGKPGQPSSPVQAGFTAMGGQSSTASSTQTIGAFQLTVEGQGFFSTGASADAIDPSVQNLYRDYYYNNSTANGDGVKVTIVGVTPNKDYDVTVWSFDADNFSPTPTVWSAVADTIGDDGLVTNYQDPLPMSLADNSVKIRVRSTTDTLTLFGTTTGGTGGTRLNAIELNLALQGDLNDDGLVDIFDVNIVSDNWGGSGPAGDANGDGTVDIFDVNLISDNWSPGDGAAAVPEPSAWIMGFIAAIGCWRLIHRRR